MVYYNFFQKLNSVKPNYSVNPYTEQNEFDFEIDQSNFKLENGNLREGLSIMSQPKYRTKSLFAFHTNYWLPTLYYSICDSVSIFVFLDFFSHKKQCILFSKWFPLVIKSSWKSRPKVWEIAKIDVFWVGQVSHV